MAERIQQTNEYDQDQAEQLRSESEKQHEQIREHLEQHVEKDGEKLEASSARHEALEAAQSTEKETKKEQVSPAERRQNTTRPTKKSLKDNYKRELKHIQSELPASSRAFSKVIHNPLVEKVSDVTGDTIARPNAILTAAISAFVLTSAIYLIARYYGYPLSGFETIGATIIGWILGIIFDFVRIMITGKKS